MKHLLIQILVLISLLIGSENIGAQNTPAVLHFPRFQTPGLVDRPSFWKVRPEEITSIVRSVKKGKYEQIATTPGKWPVWAVKRPNG